MKITDIRDGLLFYTDGSTKLASDATREELDAANLALYGTTRPTKQQIAAKRPVKPSHAHVHTGKDNIDYVGYLDHLGTLTRKGGQDAQDAQDTQAHPYAQDDRVATYADVAALVADVSWSWNQWLPNGYATLLVSEPGAGKSYLALWIARIFAQGGNFPDGSPYTGKTGRILWCETESAQSLQLARSADIDLPLEFLLCPLPNPLDTVDLCDDGHRRRIEMVARREDVALIVLDSLSGASGKAKENTSEEMRPIVQWLADLARNLNKPLLCTHHFNKIQFTPDTPPLSKIRGSSVILQFFRIIIAVDAPDLSNQQRKRLSVIKSNLALAPAPLGFEITAGEILFMPAPDAQRPKTALDAAVSFLADYLKTGLKYPQLEIAEAAKKRGIAEKTLMRAKKALGVASRKEYNSFSHVSTWYWQLASKNPSDNSDMEGGTE